MAAAVGSVLPHHVLLQKSSNAAGHDTRKSSSGASSAFSDYLFGPLSSDGSRQSANSKASLPIAHAKEVATSRQN